MWPSSTPVAKSSRRRRTRSTPLLGAADLKGARPRRRSSPSDAWPSGMARELADQSSPDADAVLGFDSYDDDMSGHLRRILAGEKVVGHVPSDRRRLLPLSPVVRRTAPAPVALPGHDSGAEVVTRARLGTGPWAPLKIATAATGVLLLCDPDVSGVLRLPPTDWMSLLKPGGWGAGRQGTLPCLRELRPAAGPRRPRPPREGPARVVPNAGHRAGARVSYLQPAEIRPRSAPRRWPVCARSCRGTTCQPACPPTVLRRMRRLVGPSISCASSTASVSVSRAPASAPMSSSGSLARPSPTSRNSGVLPRGRRPRCHRCLRLLRRGRHRGRAPGDKLDPRHRGRTARITDLVESADVRIELRHGRGGRRRPIDEIDDETGEPIGRAEHQAPGRWTVSASRRPARGSSASWSPVGPCPRKGRPAGRQRHPMTTAGGPIRRVRERVEHRQLPHGAPHRPHCRSSAGSLLAHDGQSEPHPVGRRNLHRRDDLEPDRRQPGP